MPTILVADDDANIRELVCLFLRNDGLTTAEAADGEEALNVYATTQVDLVVLSCKLSLAAGQGSRKTAAGLERYGWNKERA